MRQPWNSAVICLMSIAAPAVAAPAAEMHPMNDGYVIATFQKYVGPDIYLCPDEMVKKKNDSCGAQVKGLSAQQYLDGRFGPRKTRAVGLQPGKTANHVVILYQIYRGGLEGPAAQ
jgi:hypothetical protein